MKELCEGDRQMATINLVPICPQGSEKAARITLDRYEKMIRLAGYAKRHQLLDNPQDADIILFYISYPLNMGFLDPWRTTLRSHALLEEFRAKSVVFDLDGEALPFAPGLYTGIDRRWYDPKFHRTGPYTHHDYLWDEDLEPKYSADSAKLLFSFIGASNTHPCRQKILQITHSRAVIQDTALINPWKNEQLKRKWHDEYTDSIHSSKFVLCPRGRASSSVRVYEVMKSGRVPVIISDAWIPPVGPDWDLFSLFISENDISDIPKLLETRERNAPEMGKIARENYENWFSKEVVFDRIVDWSLEILDDQGSLNEGWQTLGLWRYIMLSPYQLRRYVLSPIKHSLKR